nr:RHS repeat-associated core domain-containing protein [Acetanaerobacterium elongatum]
MNGTEYYYIRNGQNDITGILDTSGSEVVSYSYDTWGKLLGITGSLADTVGVKNPYRYRGYRYDTETGLYYLNSRYYDPEVGRFINVDAYLGSNRSIISYNLFAYCDNNPIIYRDPSGHFKLWDQFLGFIKSFFGIDDKQVDAITSAAPAIIGTSIPLSKGYSVRIDQPRVKNDQKHIHVEKNKSEVANQNEDGTPHHKNKNKKGEPPNSIKKEIKEKTGWDWDANVNKIAVNIEVPYGLPGFIYAPVPGSGTYSIPDFNFIPGPLGDPIFIF